MSAPKTAFLSSDLLRETRELLGSATAPALKVASSVAADAVMAATAGLRERLYLQYGGAVLQALGTGGTALSDREMFERLRSTMPDATLAQFRLTLAEMVRRGLVESAGPDPVFGDPRYTLTSPAG